MLSATSRFAAIALAACTGLWACGPTASEDTSAVAEPTPPVSTAAPEEQAAPARDLEALRKRASTVLGTLPSEATSEDNPLTAEKIDLGRTLYYDPRFSISGEISCNTCHMLDQGGDDGEPTSIGHEEQRGERNAPTVYNAAFHVAQFWDGRAADVEEQAKGPVLNPVEMGMPSEDFVLRVMRAIPGYQEAFAAAFPGAEEPITFDNFARAVGAFERRLVTSDRFDAFLEGDDGALSEKELDGLQTFLDVGCTTCHLTPTVGGTLYRKLGLVKPYETEDPGRMAVTGQEADRGVFKVPSLRNVADTDPYFHDGSIESLDQAIRLMGEHQLGRTLDEAQVSAIEAFLRALSGTIDPGYIAKPELPESGPDMPSPDSA